MTAEELLPKLPKPSELRPFPTQPSLYFTGHKHRVTSMALSDNGEFIASADFGGHILIFEISSTRIVQEIQLPGKITSIDWKNGVLLAAFSSFVVLIETDAQPFTKNFISLEMQKELSDFDDFKEELGTWQYYKRGSKEYEMGLRARIYCGDNDLMQVTFHAKGDYFGSLAPKASNRNE